MPTVPGTRSKQPWRGVMVVALCLFPVAAHLVLLWRTWGGPPGWRVLDTSVSAGFTLYLVAAIFFLQTGRRLSLYRLMAATYSVLCSVLAAEAGLRLYCELPPPDAPMAPTHQSAVASDKIVGISGPIEFSVNQLGLRGPEVNLDDVDLRILCIGGSTTQCRYVTDRESWPWRVSTELNERLGQSVFVGNAGRLGHCLSHHAYQLRHYAIADQFQWVVLLAGFNDAMRYIHGTDPDAGTVAEEALTPNFLTAFLANEGGRMQGYYRQLLMYRLVRLWWVKRSSRTIVSDPEGLWIPGFQRRRREALAKACITEPPRGLPEALARYRKRLQDILQLCQGRRQSVLLMTQPTIYRDDLTPAEQDLLTFFVFKHGALAHQAAARIMAAFNDVTRDVSRAAGVPCLDLARELPKSTVVHYDDCHFNQNGSRLVAELVTDFFIRELTDGNPEQ